METLRKQMLVGLARRPEWEDRLKIVLNELVAIVGLQLDEGEASRLAGLPGALGNLIYAGVVQSVVVEFAGQACEVKLVYYPDEKEQDDLDVSVLRAADWEVDAMRVLIRVDELGYASGLAGPAVEDFCSDRLAVRLEQVLTEDGDDAGERKGGARRGRLPESDAGSEQKEDQ